MQKRATWRMLIAAGAIMSVLVATAPVGTAGDHPPGDPYRQIAKIRDAAIHRWPLSYGGIWIKDRGWDSTIYLAFTKKPKLRVKKLARDFEWPGELVPVKVKRSMVRLEAMQRKINRDQPRIQNGTLKLPGINEPFTSWGISDRRNLILIGMEDPNPQAARTIRTRYRGAAHMLPYSVVPTPLRTHARA